MKKLFYLFLLLSNFAFGQDTLVRAKFGDTYFGLNINNLGWNINGNTIVGNEYIGTRNNQPVSFRSGGQESFRVLANRKTTFGTAIYTGNQQVNVFGGIFSDGNGTANVFNQSVSTNNFALQANTALPNRETGRGLQTNGLYPFQCINGYNTLGVGGIREIADFRGQMQAENITSYEMKFGNSGGSSRKSSRLRFGYTDAITGKGFLNLEVSPSTVNTDYVKILGLTHDNISSDAYTSTRILDGLPTTIAWFDDNGILRKSPVSTLSGGATTNVLERTLGTNSGNSNFLRSTVNNVQSADIPILDNVGLSYNAVTKTLSWTANGVLATSTVSPQTTNTLVLVGNTLTSTLNGVAASTVLPSSSAISGKIDGTNVPTATVTYFGSSNTIVNLYNIKGTWSKIGNVATFYIIAQGDIAPDIPLGTANSPGFFKMFDFNNISASLLEISTSTADLASGVITARSQLQGSQGTGVIYNYLSSPGITAELQHTKSQSSPQGTIFYSISFSVYYK